MMINLKILKDFLREQSQSWCHTTHTLKHTHVHMLDQMMEPEKRLFILDRNLSISLSEMQCICLKLMSFCLFFFPKKVLNKIYFIKIKAIIFLILIKTNVVCLMNALVP